MSDRKLRNAKEEYLRATKDCKVIAASITFDTIRDEGSHKLNPLYTTEEYNNFLEFLDYDYDSGYGGQNLYGVIYCEDGVWLQRGEYDGSEWWDIFKYPDMRESFDESFVIKYERNKKLKIITNLIE
jgi:hypothetical protein